MTDHLTRLINAKQMENESLLNYSKRFKELHDNARSQLGSKILDAFVEKSKEYRELTSEAKKTTKMKQEAYDAWVAYLFIRGSDQAKYGSLTRSLISQYSLGNDQYPKTLQAAGDVLSSHRMDQRHFDNQRKNRDQQHNGGPGKQQDGNTPPPATSFAQQDGIWCHVCGKKGHKKPQCPDINNIPRNQWAINKAHSNLQGKPKDDDGEAKID